MKQSGRASLLTILALVAVVIVIGLLAFARESSASIAARFMDALSAGDSKVLSEMTYLGDDTPEELRKQWDFAVNTAGKHYVFVYRIVGSNQPSEDSANVRVQVVRNAYRSGAYEEAYTIPLVKVGDEWKVDVKGISREMYPGLPR